MKARERNNYRLRFLSSPQEARFSSSDLLGIITLSAIGLHVLGFGVDFLQYLTYKNLSHKPAPTLVQMADGSSIHVAPLGSLERTPEVIQEFVRATLAMLMTWEGTVPSPAEGGQEIKDKGVKIRSPEGRHGKVTTPAYQAAFALSEDFRKEFLTEVARLTPAGVFQGDTQVIFVPIDIGNPVKIESGKWRVPIVANLIVVDNTNVLGETIAFNKDVFIRAVTPPQYASHLQGVAQIVQAIRTSGLEIYAIRDLQQQEL